ncbi:hypothetical protein EON62_04905 [archaeon]|nr:MAG: hypothetical protein EON62_04905 [archaeon]
MLSCTPCRQCFGAGCDGYLYCSSCFITYHPLGDEAWVAHWDAEVCAATPVIKEGTTLPAGELLLMEGRIPPAARGVHALVGDDEAKLVVSRRPVRMKLLIRNYEEIEAAEAARREQEEEEARAREAGEDDASAGAGGRRVRRTRTGSKDGERGRSLKRTNSGSSRSNSKSMRTKSRGSERSSSKGGGGRASSNGGRRSK